MNSELKLVTAMKILWITAINETEYDIIETFKHMPKHELHIICTRPKNDYFFDVRLPKDANIIYTRNLEDLKKAICHKLEKYSFDLVIKRAGWGTQQAPFLVPNLAEYYNVPCALWCSEQGEQRDWQYKIAMNYKIILVNNYMDYEYYRIKRPDAKIYSLPFGCAPTFHKPAKPVSKYKTDIVCYSNPLYNEYTSKKRCIDDMIIPVITSPALMNHKLMIWGLETWEDIGIIQESGVYKGKFTYNLIPKVNASCKIHIGISASIFHGGYGSKLIRALACGTFTLWHDTVGIMDDFKDGYHLILTNSPDRTIVLLKYYLENHKSRRRIAAQGRNYAIKTFDYKILFNNLFKEMGL